jgi:Protein of unknown function (DUF3105)
MATRKEEKERLRQARLEAERREAAEARRKLIFGYVAAGAIAAVVLAGIVAVVIAGRGEASGEAHLFVASGSTNDVQPDGREGTPPPPLEEPNLEAAAEQAGCVLRLNLPDEGHAHLPPGSQTPDYKTNPPTSGPHVQAPFQQADGAYAEEPPAIAFVHSLEHGRMEIQYSPDLPEKQQLELKGLYDTMYAGALLYPNRQMPYAVAATTWTNLLGCKTYKGSITLDAIRDFGRQTWGRFGGESVQVAAGPTPASPSQ